MNPFNATEPGEPLPQGPHRTSVKLSFRCFLWLYIKPNFKTNPSTSTSETMTLQLPGPPGSEIPFAMIFILHEFQGNSPHFIIN